MEKPADKHRFPVLYWLLAVLPLILTVLVFPAAPDTIPAHYGINNQVNRWGSKYELFLFPAIMLMLAPLLRGLSSMGNLKPGEQSESARISSQKAAMRVCYGSLILFNLLNGFMLYTALNKVTNLSAIGYDRVLAFAISVLQIVIGNILPKCKQNYIIGIRVPWTLESETVWYRTHRFGGKLDVAAGAVCLVLSLMLPQKAAFWVAMGALLATAVAAVIYSYYAFVQWKASGEK